MPSVLDLYCGVGGCSRGYANAGFDAITGVDFFPQRDYPYTFVEGDVFTKGKELLYSQPWDLVHASPPCLAETRLNVGGNKGKVDHHVSLIKRTREMLLDYGKPWVMENVVGANLRWDLVLCGEYFGLDVIRHRIFELHGFTVPQPPHPEHKGYVSAWRNGKLRDGPYVAVYGNGGGKSSIKVWQDAMGIDWTTKRTKIAQAIPPKYTEHIGRAFLERSES